MSRPPTRGDDRMRRNRRVALIVIFALAATFVIPVLVLLAT